MLSQIILKSYSYFIELSLWIILIAGIVIGGKIGGLLWAIGGLIVGFVISTVIMGAFLILDDIRKRVENIEKR